MAENSRASQTLIPTVVIALLAGYGVIGSLSNSAPTRSEERVTQSLTQHRDSSRNTDNDHLQSAAQLLDQFLGTTPIELDKDRPWLHQYTAPADLQSALKNYRVRFIIATLPEPASPALRSEFDNDLGGIVSAAFDNGYTIDRLDLPWTDSRESKDGSSSSSLPAEIDVVLPQQGIKLLSPKHSEKPDLWRTRPGIILFRSSNDPTQLLILFVVGEMQTSGVVKPAMRDALEQIWWFWSSSGSAPSRVHDTASDNPPTLSIIGPSFSGSAASLRNELESWITQPSISADSKIKNLKIVFATGSATAIDKNDLCGSMSKRCELVQFTMPDIERWRIVIPDLKNGIATATPLPEHNGTSLPFRRSPTIALLSEESIYGAVGGELVHNLSIVMPFPPQISSVRTAFESLQLSRVPAGLELNMPDVPERSETSDSSSDLIPSFSTRSPSYDQTMLNELLRRIADEGVQYVGVTATDVSDLIFLAGSVHQNSPNATLFTLSSDLRMLRQAVEPTLYGMLVFSSYPLIPYDRQLTKPLSREWLSEDAAGIYYATSEAIGEGFHNNDSGRYVLWTSVVGRDQEFWPVSFQRSSSHCTFTSFSQPPDKYHSGFKFALLALCLICGFVTPAFLPSGSPPVLQLCPEFIRRIADAWTRGRAGPKPQTYLYARSLRIGLATALLVAFSFLWIAHIRDIGIGLAAYLFYGVLTCYVLLFLVSTANGSATDSSHLSIQDYVSSPQTLSVVVLISAVFFCTNLYRIDPNYVPLVFRRSVALSNGVSPLRVLLLLAIAGLILSYCHLRQGSLLEDAGFPKGGFLGFTGCSFKGIDRHEQRIVDLLGMPPVFLPGAVLLLVFVLAQSSWYLLKANWFGYALDGPWFGIFFVVAGTIVYGGLFLLLLRLVVVWVELRQLLRRLYSHPTRGGYIRLRASRFGDKDGPALRFLRPPHDLTAVEYCLERVRELVRLAQDKRNSQWHPFTTAFDLAEEVCKAKLQAAIAACEVCLERVIASQGDWRELASTDLALQTSMKALSESVTKLFAPVWRLALADPPTSAMGDSDEHKLVDQVEYFIASRVLDFIRRLYPQMVNLVGFAVTGILALVLACSAYPMPAPDTILTLAWLALLVAVGVSLYVFVRMNMNGVLSMLQGTTPNYFTLNSTFILQLLFVGVIPILAMLGAQFPYKVNPILGWVGGLAGTSH